MLSLGKWFNPAKQNLLVLATFKCQCWCISLIYFCYPARLHWAILVLYNMMWIKPRFIRNCSFLQKIGPQNWHLKIHYIHYHASLLHAILRQVLQYYHTDRDLLTTPRKFSSPNIPKNISVPHQKVKQSAYMKVLCKDSKLFFCLNKDCSIDLILKAFLVIISGLSQEWF